MSETYVDENIDCKPQPGEHFDPNANLTPEAGFLLSQADGTLSVREILQILPFPKAQVGEMLSDLRRRGILSWSGGTEPPPAPKPDQPAAPANDADGSDAALDEIESLLDDDFEGMDFSGTETTAAPADLTGDSADEIDYGFESANDPSGEITSPESDELEVHATNESEPEPDEAGDFGDELDDIDALLDDIDEPDDTDAEADIDDAAAVLADLGESSDTQTADTAADEPDDIDDLLEEAEATWSESTGDVAPEADGDDDTSAALDEIDALLDDTDIEPDFDDGSDDEMAQKEPEPDAAETADTADFADIALEPTGTTDESATEAADNDEPDPELMKELGALDEDFESVIADLEGATDETPPEADEIDVAELDDDSSVDDTAEVAAEPVDEDELTADDLVEAETDSDEGFDLDDGDIEPVFTSDDDNAEAAGGSTQPKAKASQPDDGNAVDDPFAKKVRAPSKPAKPAPKPTSDIATPGESEIVVKLRKRIAAQHRLLAKDDPFTALGVKGGSSDKQIRDAWHRLSRTFHPDRYYNVDLPDDLGQELETVYTDLQEAYNLIATREARRAFMFGKRDERLQSAKTKTQPGGDPDATGDGQTSVADAERLVELAEDAINRGQYQSAIMNLKLAGQMTHKDAYTSKAKLIELLSKVEGRISKLLDLDETPLPEEIESVITTVDKIQSVLPNNAALLKLISQFLFEHAEPTQLERSMVERLLKLNRLPDTLVLGAKIYLKANLPQTALDLLDDAKERDSGNPEIKNLIKEAKRSLKK